MTTYAATSADVALIEEALRAAVRKAADGSDTGLAEVRSIEAQLADTYIEGAYDQGTARNALMRRVQQADPSAWTVTRMRLAGPRVMTDPSVCGHCGADRTRHARWCRLNRSM